MHNLLEKLDDIHALARYNLGSDHEMSTASRKPRNAHNKKGVKLWLEVEARLSA